jgi:hypothetical protein
MKTRSGSERSSQVQRPHMSSVYRQRQQPSSKSNQSHQRQVQEVEQEQEQVGR